MRRGNRWQHESQFKRKKLKCHAANWDKYSEYEQFLDKLSIEWQKQLERRYGEIDKMYKKRLEINPVTNKLFFK